jgi:hypothetical protein
MLGWRRPYGAVDRHSGFKFYMKNFGSITVLDGVGSGAPRQDIYMLFGTSLPNCPGQTHDAPMEPYISHKNKAKREIHCSFIPTFHAPCCEANCPRAKQGEMGLRKPEFSGTTRILRHDATLVR